MPEHPDAEWIAAFDRTAEILGEHDAVKVCCGIAPEQEFALLWDNPVLLAYYRRQVDDLLRRLNEEP